MKIFNSLPEVLHRKGKTYKVELTISINEAKKRLKAEKTSFYVIYVLSRNLRGRTDLHGNLYKPTEWLFVEQKPKQDEA